MFLPVNSRTGLEASLPDRLSPHMIPSMFQIAGSGRASMSMPIRVTILSRKDCYLCDVVYRIATRLQSELHIEASKVPIEGDMVLVERYGTRVPVVLLDEVEYFVGNVTEGELRRAIKKARWRKPISRILFRLGYAPRRG
jgi:Glutaredoxin-like domain (DUF836)